MVLCICGAVSLWCCVFVVLCICGAVYLWCCVFVVFLCVLLDCIVLNFSMVYFIVSYRVALCFIVFLLRKDF